MELYLLKVNLYFYKKINIMRNFTLFTLLMCFGLSFSQVKSTAQIDLFGKIQEVETINGYVKCASTEYEEYLQNLNKNRQTEEQFENWINAVIATSKNKNAPTASPNNVNIVITIPVVVHVIHSGQNVGVAPNITDAQAISQITVLNNDFRRLAGTPGFNTNTVGADTEIQFVLATIDPSGNPTSGINRVNLCQPSWSTTQINNTVKPSTIWDPTKYLNMWSVNFTDSQLLGYAQFPSSSGLPGLDSNGGSASTDGVVAAYSTFGSINFNDGTFLLNAPYNEGRTMTHEVGHWVALRHIWGDSTCGDDFCADTPVHNSSNGGCPTLQNCSNTGLQMVQNYMDYTNDSCMNIYTINQKDRITAVMNNSPRRVELKTSNAGTPIVLFPNDAEVKVETVCTAPSSNSCGAEQSFQKLTLFNRGTTTMTAATLSYTVNGGASQTYNWSGSILPNKFAAVNMPVNSSTSGTINVTVVTVNGISDQRSSNNASSGNFTALNGPVNYTNGLTSVVFRLKRDNFGSQTTWNLKNSVTGATLYSGGPYTNQTGGGITITQTWSVPSGACYTFTINDSGNNGICCGSGNGFYDIKSPDGTITVAEGGQFASVDSRAFSINYLSNSTFDTVEDLYLFPNPAKDFITISTSNGLPEEYTIYNTIGQKIAQKTIISNDDLTINTSSFSNGIYLISVKKGTDKKTIRFIKE